jgi:hypothetical protein
LVVPRNGVNTFARRSSTESYFDIEGYTSILNGEVDSFSGIFADKWSDTILKGIKDAEDLVHDIETLSSVNPTTWNGASGSLAESMKVVNQLMQTRKLLLR